MRVFYCLLSLYLFVLTTKNNAMEMNFISPVVAAFTTLLVGFVWYHPKVFGTAWMKYLIVGPPKEFLSPSPKILTGKNSSQNGKKQLIGLSSEALRSDID